MNKKNIHITKASGDRVLFSEEKLRRSLERSGATEVQMDSVVAQIQSDLYEGMSTGKIYRKAYELLRKRSKPHAARYKLKKAIMELGPSGYPFERFVGAMLQQQGYRVQIGVMMEGRCVTHEIDVLAEKNDKLILAECKFHNRPGVKCDVKIPLYIHSRYRDVIMARSGRDEANAGRPGKKIDGNHLADPGSEIREYEGWIVTNTRFTDDAIRYGTCSGLVMLGWDYPAKNGLRQRIGLSGLHPVTCLSTLNRKEKMHLLEKGVVLCRSVPVETKQLHELGLTKQRIAKVVDECLELVGQLGVPEQ